MQSEGLATEILRIERRQTLFWFTAFVISAITLVTKSIIKS